MSTVSSQLGVSHAIPNKKKIEAKLKVESFSNISAEGVWMENYDFLQQQYFGVNKVCVDTTTIHVDQTLWVVKASQIKLVRNAG